MIYPLQVMHQLHGTCFIFMVHASSSWYMLQLHESGEHLVMLKDFFSVQQTERVFLVLQMAASESWVKAKFMALAEAMGASQQRQCCNSYFGCMHHKALSAGLVSVLTCLHEVGGKIWLTQLLHMSEASLDSHQAKRYYYLVPIYIQTLLTK